VREEQTSVKVRAVDFYYYQVADMERALAFYEGSLGLRLAKREGPDWTELEVGTAILVLAVSPPQYSRPPGSGTVALAVADVAAALEELRAQHVRILAEVWETSVCWNAVIADPDDNRIWLHQRKDGTAG
jgi:predicted enzyme related to lactoylglutathione lyase